MAELKDLLSVKQVAELFGVEPRVVRKEARKNAIPGQVLVFNKYYGFDPDAVTSWKPPEAGTFGPRRGRDDGRSWYRIALSPEEFAALNATYEIVDPRVAAKARRAAKKAAKTEGGEGTDVAQDVAEASEGDPFADFGA